MSGQNRQSFDTMHASLLQADHASLVDSSCSVSGVQEFKGYIFKIMGGQDKQGFPMKQGVLVPGRVRLLMAPGDTCFPRVRPETGRAPEKVCPRMHCVPGPQRAQPHHRQEGCAVLSFTQCNFCTTATR